MPSAGWVGTIRWKSGSARGRPARLGQAQPWRHRPGGARDHHQRETTVVWDPVTGEPCGNAIVWQDTRTDKIAAALDRDGRGDVIRHRAGLPPATYFSGGKLQWILENVDGVEAAERGRALFGTTDSWLLWNLTGGVDGGLHIPTSPMPAAPC